MENKDIQSELEWDDRILRYMKDKMDSMEEKQFLSEMKSDELLRQDVITQARLVRGMRQVDDELVRALKNSSEDVIRSAIRSRKSTLKKSVVWLSMVASIAIIIVVGYKGYDYYHITRLGMKYATAFPMETIVRGDLDIPVEFELQMLFDNVVRRKDLNATTDRLSKLWEISNQDTYNEYTDFAPYIGWYLAIGYLEEYKKDKAESALLAIEQLSIDLSSELQSKIKSILNEI